MKKISLALAAVLALSAASPAFAKGASFSGSRSFSSSSYRASTPSYTYPTPAPAYKAPAAPAPTVVQKNVTVQQNVTHVTQSAGGSGGGFFSSMFGSFAGAGIATWLFSPKPQAAAPQVDCQLEQNKALAVCQPAKH